MRKKKKNNGSKYRWLGLLTFILSVIMLDKLPIGIVGLLQFIGIILLLFGGLIGGWFDNAGEQIMYNRMLNGQCPHCGTKIGYGKSKCPSCTADL